MRNIPKEHQIYRHFKGDLYQIVTIAKHSETQEEMVVYRPIYKDSGNWVRPLSMFLSEVDREKYPDATQKYRFTLMDRGRAIEEEEIQDQTIKPQKDEPKEDIKREEIQEEKLQKDEPQKDEPQKDESKKAECEPDSSEVGNSDGLDPLLEQFLDAGSYQEKLDVFYLMKRRGNINMLRYVAMSLDIEVAEADFDEMYRQIFNCLKTMEKYECNRLRS